MQGVAAVEFTLAEHVGGLVDWVAGAMLGNHLRQWALPVLQILVEVVVVAQLLRELLVAQV
jgi:hypothetical protein